MSGARGEHLALEALLEYWLGDADTAATDAADEHLMRCDRCGEALDELVALGQGVRAALRAGAVVVATSPAFVTRLAAGGLRVREYRLAPAGSVNCTLAPEDEVLVSRLAAPLAGVQRLDVRIQLSDAPHAPIEQHDVPFDPGSGEVVLVADVPALRRRPAHTLRITLLAPAGKGSARELGRYTFNHVPWPGSQPG